MKYKNTKTGFILDTSDEVTGQDWVKLSPDNFNISEKGKEEEPEEKPKRKRAAKE